jgi:hypothetical protein
LSPTTTSTPRRIEVLRAVAIRCADRDLADAGSLGAMPDPSADERGVTPSSHRCRRPFRSRLPRARDVAEKMARPGP